MPDDKPATVTINFTVPQGYELVSKTETIGHLTATITTITTIRPVAAPSETVTSVKIDGTVTEHVVRAATLAERPTTPQPPKR